MQLLRGKSSSGNISPVFRDREELASSVDLSERINDALAASESLILVCLPQARASRWVDQEIRTFKQLGRSDRVFCLIVAGEPSSKDMDEDCFPPSLRIQYGPDGACLDLPVEPIAADARKEGDGRSLAFLKIVAGLLGVGLDDLRQREVRRRQRRLVAVTAGSLAGVVITSALALYAVLASNEADRRRQQAEDLLGCMAGDLRINLTLIGRLDLVGFVHWRNGSLEVAEEWLSRYRDTSEALLELDASRDDWVREVRYAYHNLAVLAVERGDLEGAGEGFSFLVSVLESLRARDDDPHLNRELAEAVSWMGNVSLSRET